MGVLRTAVIRRQDTHPAVCSCNLPITLLLE
jgi:hypothetical protein